MTDNKPKIDAARTHLMQSIYNLIDVWTAETGVHNTDVWKNSPHPGSQLEYNDLSLPELKKVFDWAMAGYYGADGS